MNIKISRNDQEFGPYTMEELTQYVNEGSILPNDYAYDGMEWVTVSQLLKDPQRAADRAQSIANVAKIKYESNYSEVGNKKEIIGKIFKWAIASSLVVLAAYMVINFILKPYFSPLDNNIVDKIITFDVEGSEMQLMFSSDGKMVSVEDDWLVENPNIKYNVKGKEVSVYAEDGEITVFLFSSKNPKAGDPLVMGNDVHTVKATIVNIESREDKKLVNHNLIKQQQYLGSLYHVFFSLYGLKDLKKQFPFEEEIFEGSRLGETLKKHPTTGKIKPVLYNHLGKWDADSIILATPWVIDGHRVVVFGDSGRQIVEEKKYQKLIQQKGVEMKPILPLNSIDQAKQETNVNSKGEAE
mgnify:CR=1 FL=1